MVTAVPERIEEREQTNQSSLEQREPLLWTKLFIPPIRPNRVTRLVCLNRSIMD